MEKRNISRNQKGFTLIEIIAVLIILGLLAAVAVPKYLDMTAQANAKAITMALAAGASNVTMQSSKMLLNNSAEPTEADLVTALNLAANGHITTGDFTISYTAMGSATIGVTVTVTAGPSDVTIPTPNPKKDVILVK